MIDCTVAVIIVSVICACSIIGKVDFMPCKLLQSSPYASPCVTSKGDLCEQCSAFSPGPVYSSDKIVKCSPNCRVCRHPFGKLLHAHSGFTAGSKSLQNFLWFTSTCPGVAAFALVVRNVSMSRCLGSSAIPSSFFKQLVPARLIKCFGKKMLAG